MTNEGVFILLNEAKSLASVGWTGNNCEKLWRYHQHYFDDLNAFGAINRKALQLNLMLNWVQENKIGSGIGWQPYPTSLRIVNWIKWELAGNNLPKVCSQSLATQTRYLFKNIEWHIRGNHLFANAKALVFAGLFFCGQEAENWFNSGLKILRSQISEQIRGDGGHFELSPMYHSIILEDILDIINLMRAYRCNYEELKLEETASKMLQWLEYMCHPDGEISFFNDSALNLAPSQRELASYAARLNIVQGTTSKSKNNIQIKHLTETGYISLFTSNSKVLIDVADIGPKYLPGGMDMLTFCHLKCLSMGSVSL